MIKFFILLMVPFYFLACHTPSQPKDAHDGVWSGKATADNYGKWCTDARLNLTITNKKKPVSVKTEMDVEAILAAM